MVTDDLDQLGEPVVCAPNDPDDARLLSQVAGDKVDDRYQGKTTPYQLPEQRNGLVFIFRTFEHVSYGLIMEAERPVQAGDSAHTP